ncbi:MAG: class I adenylate-forming enzyme family protein [Gammaproteobacteria bacterium]
MTGASSISNADPANSFAAIPDLLHAHAKSRPENIALIQDGREITYSALDGMANRVAAALQRDGVRPRDLIAICAAISLDYVVIFLGALRVGAGVAPLPGPFGPRSVASMIADTNASKVFLDRSTAEALRSEVSLSIAPILIDAEEHAGLEAWMAESGSVPAAVNLQPDWPFNVIYSSGTTGNPKGIVQSHAFRWSNVRRASRNGYDHESVTLLSTPLYSNTTLATLVGALGMGGTVLLMGKFDTDGYLALAQRYRATHTMLVPIQYQRLLANENFGRIDLSSFKMKFSTGAPFPQALKEQVLRRWPGGLIEIYGLTEGGATCVLEAHKIPHKLHTVGIPLPGHDLRVIDAEGRELASGETGEIVGHSPAMMSGYLNQPTKTHEAQWWDAGGKRFIRSGDIGRVDSDGFVMLLDRKKDLIISGGFNIYPSDLEAVLREHPDIGEAAVFGVSSTRWGETPAACVVLKPAARVDAAALTLWANQRLGKMQGISAMKIMRSLPRNAAGKVLKRELRDSFAPRQDSASVRLPAN